MSNQSIAEKRAKQFHSGKSGFLSLPKEKFLSKYNPFTQKKNTTILSCLFKVLIYILGLKLYF